MDITIEMIDIYDRDGQRTGRVVPKSTELGPGEFRRVTQIIVFNSAGQLLCQQRTRDEEDFWSNLWDVTCCGALLAGEDSRTGAARELREELGIDIDFSHRMPKVTVCYGPGFSDVFILELDVALEDLTLQAEEVQAARWISREEILEMIQDRTFVPYYPGWIRYLWDVRESWGTFRWE